jgi:aryl-alcohol dehydrogenase-like predicted oxidoreductase/ferredoxin
MGPLQRDLTIEEGGELLLKGFSMGINFLDTAKLYGTYGHIKYALNKTTEKITIATKSYDYTYEGMKDSVNEALELMGVKKINIFLLHEQESKETFKGHSDGYRYLMEQKKLGMIDAIGVSTHTVRMTDYGAMCNDIDVIHPIYNMNGIGIQDGSIHDMEKAIKKCFLMGKGIYIMKPLGGGNLITYWREAMDFLLKFPYYHSIAFGMQYEEEIIVNSAYITNTEIKQEAMGKLKLYNRELLIDDWCEGCGSCIGSCQFKALTIYKTKAIVNRGKCVKCGYCSNKCPNFCIKII